MFPLGIDLGLPAIIALLVLVFPEHSMVLTATVMSRKNTPSQLGH
jgi:hypothetical protein